MSVYRKHSVPVQFLTFGVDHKGIIIPVLKRGKDNFVHLPPVARPLNDQVKNPQPAR
ncbi:MAG TPA: hypothetical protein VEL06_15465 [Haliangiales bacterium]|nr:hypothetical protein [Haliangiales bacterium]